MSDIDPFEILKGSNPYPVETAPTSNSGVGLRIRDSVDERIDEARGDSSGRKLVYFVAALVAAALLVAAGWAIRRAVPSDPVNTICFVDADEESHRTQVVGSSIEGCRTLWESGEFSNSVLPRSGQVPTLVGCVAPDGLLWVFPTDDLAFCEGLGLDRHKTDVGSAVAELQSLLIADYPPGTCGDPTDVLASAERLLVELEGLEEWSVSAPPLGGEGLCASFSVDATIKQVVIVPIPPEE